MFSLFASVYRGTQKRFKALTIKTVSFVVFGETRERRPPTAPPTFDQRGENERCTTFPLTVDICIIFFRYFFSRNFLLSIRRQL
mmetsp:Transcript_12365/g.29976  ORF Transcript_12365/g.29976 Transcript_12365/m.29976 type:complete len:84 (+) Transcript_12365:1523-1774(+)